MPRLTYLTFQYELIERLNQDREVIMSMLIDIDQKFRCNVVLNDNPSEGLV
ncbi:hypothetical protein POAN111098_06330 [Polynucleobacter antarcticus]